MSESKTPKKIKQTVENTDLSDYKQIPLASAFNIPIGSFIRYEKQDGTLVNGGLLAVKIEKKGDAPQKFMLTASSMGKSSWTVFLPDIKSLYTNAVYYSMYSKALNGVVEHINKLISMIKTQDSQITALTRKVATLERR